LVAGRGGRRDLASCIHRASATRVDGVGGAELRQAGSLGLRNYNRQYGACTRL
jgi:hypothetical protein